MSPRKLIAVALILLAALSALLTLWQWYAARRFQFQRKTIGAGFSPPLSVLRPVKGCDSTTEECLQSWFQQDYRGKVELLFGVADESDPVCGIIRRLMAKYPSQSAELILCQPILGPNAKVSSLCYLAKRAQYEQIVISDQDVFITPGLLANLVEPFHEPTVGLVNCFYILDGPQNLAMGLEAVAVNADFWSQVLQGNMLKPMNFALGAVMATTRERLLQIGGFEALLDYLADDYQLGHRIAQTGARILLCPTPVECRADAQSAVTVWNHQLRWARTVRVCQPVPYFFSILSNGTLWPLLAFWAAPVRMWIPAAIAIALRMVTAVSNYAKLAPGNGWKWALLAPLKDLLQVPIWALAFFGKTITWRNQRFHVNAGGKLTPLA